jgi:SAM-dependent methyltransferase
VSDPVLGRLRDRLAVNPPYEGLIADAYDVWIPVDSEFGDDAVYRRLLAGVEGPVLELGCGTGRPLLRWVEAGHDVEGIDTSADMLAILRRHAAERGLDPVVHHGDIAPLSLGRMYAAIVCPAGTFSLIHDADRAHQALESYVAHLRPGGVLALTLFEPPPAADQPLTWRVRRTGTTADGVTVVVHEATHDAREERIQVVYNRLEAYDADGRQLGAWLRRHHLRWWPRAEIEGLLADLGFAEVRSVGGDHDWVTIATRP